jgi:hypothetical protein
VASFLVLTAAIAVGLLRYRGAADAQGGVERILQAVAFGVLVASPAVLSALSRHRRAVLLVPGAVVLTPLAVLSITGVLLPLLVPAVLLWTALVTRWDGAPCGPGRASLASVAVLALLVAGGLALFVHHDPRTWGDCAMTVTGEGSGSGWCPPGAQGGGATSDVVTPLEALVSMALVAAALAAGWLLAAPRSVRARRAG